MACPGRTAGKFEGLKGIHSSLLPHQAPLGVTWQMTPSYHFSFDFRNKVYFKIKTIFFAMLLLHLSIVDLLVNPRGSIPLN